MTKLEELKAAIDAAYDAYTGAVYTTYDDYNAAYDAYEADIAATYDAYDDAYITYRKELKKTKKEITNA